MSKSQRATLDTGCISTYWFSNLGFRDQSRVSRWREGAAVELRSSTRMKTLKTRTVNPPQTAGFITSSFMLTESSSNISSVKCPEVKTLTFVRPHTDRMNFLSEAESVWVSVSVCWTMFTPTDHLNTLMSQHDETQLVCFLSAQTRGGAGAAGIQTENPQPETQTSFTESTAESGPDLVLIGSAGSCWRARLIAKRLRVKTHKKRSHPKISSSWIYCCELLIYSKTSTAYDSRGM